MTVQSLPELSELQDLWKLLPTDGEMAALVQGLPDRDLEVLLESSFYGKARPKFFAEHYKSFLGLFSGKPRKA